jgi:hypothetical protein
MQRVAGSANLLENIRSTGRRHRPAKWGSSGRSSKSPALGVVFIVCALLLLLLLVAWAVT